MNEEKIEKLNEMNEIEDTYNKYVFAFAFIAGALVMMGFSWIIPLEIELGLILLFLYSGFWFRSRQLRIRLKILEEAFYE